MILFPLFLIFSFAFSAELGHKIHPTENHRTSTIQWVSQLDDDSDEEEKHQEEDDQTTDLSWQSLPSQTTSVANHHPGHRRQNSSTVGILLPTAQPSRASLTMIVEDPEGESNTDNNQWAKLVSPKLKRNNSGTSTKALCDLEELRRTSSIAAARMIGSIPTESTSNISSAPSSSTNTHNNPALVSPTQDPSSSSCCGCWVWLRRMFK